MAGTRILFCTTNGVGLGHLTRTMAIAKRLPDTMQPVIFTLSAAAPLARAHGFPTEYLFSAGYAGTDRGDWQLLLAERLEALIAAYHPRVVVFDGTHPYVGFYRALRAHSEPAYVWCRRAMWKPGVGRRSLRGARLFHHVIEPGEVAASDDRGATVSERERVERVAPVLSHDREDLLSKREARSQLSLERVGTWALVQLGAGAINDLSAPLAHTLAHLQSVPGVHVAYAESPIGSVPVDLPEGVRRVRRYPLLPYLRAFDFVVTAAGYNSFHETVVAGVPGLYVPNLETQVDDQLARARYAEAVGFGTSWSDGRPQSLPRALAPLLDERRRDGMRVRIEALRPRNGAHQAARSLARLAERGTP